MTVSVLPTQEQNTHHISLSDGSSTIGIIAVDNDGNPDLTTIRRDPYPKSNLIVNSSAGALSQQKSPYGEFSRSTWTGGLGIEKAEDDATSFWIARSLWTLGNKVQMAPKLFAIPDTTENICNSADWPLNADDLTIAASYYAVKITPDNNVRLDGVKVWADTASDLWVFVLASAAGSATLTSGSAQAAMVGSYPYTIPVGEYSLVSGTSYWLAFYSSGSATFTLGTTARDRRTSTNGSTWTDISTGVAPEFLLMRSQYIRTIPFEYKGADYMVQVQQDGTTRLMMVGSDAGVPTSASGSTISDTTKNWAVDRLIGATIEIISGMGMHQYRKITANTAKMITVSETWDVQPDNTSVYSLKGWDSAYEIAGTGLQFVSDVTCDNETLYFACGSQVPIRRARFANTSGSWVRTFVDDNSNKADLARFVYDQKTSGVIWRALNQSSGSSSGSYIGYSCISKAPAQSWSSGSPTNLAFGTEIFLNTDEIRGLQDMDGKLAVIQDKGIWMVLNDIPERLSIDMSFGTNYQTGVGPRLYSPYLVFPYGYGIERLLDTLMEEFRPGCPWDFSGPFCGIVPMPGAILAARAGGELRRAHPTPYANYSTGYVVTNSHVMIYRGGVWQPVAFVGYGENVLSLHLQHVEGGESWLWIGTQYHLYAMRFPEEFDLDFDPQFSQQRFSRYERSGNFITGKFYCGSMRLDKWFERIYLHGFSGAGDANIKVYYRTSEDLSGAYPFTEKIGSWTYAGKMYEAVGDSFDKIINLRVKSRWIQFLFNFTFDNSIAPPPTRVVSPFLDGFNVEYLARINDADTWIVPTNIQDYPTDLTDQVVDSSGSGLLNTLDTWGRDVTPLTMRCVFAPFDNKRVVIDRSSVQPVAHDNTAVIANGAQKEYYRINLVIREV